jgi:sugar O-acyltransferase (sialic acid O-acetyltransferase NeuD family)
MKKEKVVLLGSGGHAKCVLDILEEMDSYEVIGVTTQDEAIKDFCGYPVLGNNETLQDLYMDGIRYIALGVGGYTDNNLRKALYTKLKQIGFAVVSAIHPSAIISKTFSLGEGNIIFSGVIILPDVQVGNNVVIASGSNIGHEVIIEDHVLISTGVTIGANIKIQEGALISMGATIVSGVTVGRNAFIAAGAVVITDIEENAKVYGIPARPKLSGYLG